MNTTYSLQAQIELHEKAIKVLEMRKEAYQDLFKFIEDGCLIVECPHKENEIQKMLKSLDE